MTIQFKHAGRSAILATLLGLSLLVTGCAASKEMMDKGSKMMMSDDAAIAEGVKAALAESPDVNAKDIVVETKDGEVMLSGMVANKNEKRRAMQIANTIDGVQQIENMIKVAK